MKKSLYASAAVLALILASPALAQPTDKDDENNRPRAGHVSHDNEPPRGEKAGTTGAKFNGLAEWYDGR